MAGRARRRAAGTRGTGMARSRPPRRPSTEGWVQALTSDEANQLLEAFDVVALSLGGESEPSSVINWLIEQAETGGSDRWPREQISLHGEPSAPAIAQLDGAIERHMQLRRLGPQALSSPSHPTPEHGDECETAAAG